MNTSGKGISPALRLLDFATDRTCSQDVSGNASSLSVLSFLLSFLRFRKLYFYRRFEILPMVKWNLQMTDAGRKFH
jgi:hypothetical protein